MDSRGQVVETVSSPIGLRNCMCKGGVGPEPCDGDYSKVWAITVGSIQGRARLVSSCEPAGTATSRNSQVDIICFKQMDPKPRSLAFG